MRTEKFAAILAALALCACSSDEYTRGIGVYPGKVSDYSGPEMVKAGSEYRNLALNRVARHSSSYDYNLTAQLATDGIVTDELPHLLSVCTEEGPLPKRLRDVIFDGNDKRNLPVRAGENAFIRAEFTNCTVDCDKVTLEVDEEICEVQNIDGKVFTAQLPRTERRMAEVKLMHFYKDGEEIFPYTGESFTSCWMPQSAGQEWICVDLGGKASFDKVCLSWIGEAPKGSIEVSNDNAKWKKIADISAEKEIAVKGSGRYVRLAISESAAGTPCALSEFEVWGKGGVCPKAAAQSPEKDGSLNLKGGNWKILRASLVNADGTQLSTPGYDDASWIVATVPGTVTGSYFNAGAIPDQRYSDDQLQISESYFLSDFWYRDEFIVPESFAGNTLILDFDGINWKADVWINGQALGSIEGAFKRSGFDVTGLVEPGKTAALAVLIHRNAHTGSVKEQNRYTTDNNGGILGADNPTFHSTIGWDWIPTVRGRNIGIWNDVVLNSHPCGVSLADAFVKTDLPLPGTDKAEISASVTLNNHRGESVSGTLEFTMAGLSTSKEVKIAANESVEVALPSFTLDNPSLWWPSGYGEPYLYDCAMTFRSADCAPETMTFKTGVREMSYDDADGSLDVYINGRRLIGNGGNWGFPEIDLNYRAREYDIATAYHADMGFTLIRNWVGQTGDIEFYEACDRNGVMVWQDFWLANPWDGPDPYYEDMFMDNARDYILKIRNHPCIAFYCGRNEGMPPASLNSALAEAVAQEHPGSHYIPHSAEISVSGYGPYRALGPDAYFELTAGRSKIHSERGMPNVMNYENMCRMLEEPDRWPQNDLWGMHDYTLESAQRCETFNGFIQKAFGEPQNLREFTRRAQWINYDGYRAMYESRSWERKGLLIWMSHACWPSMVWQTYDYYFEPTAAYFGAKKGSAPIRIQFNPVTSQIEVVNNCALDRQDVKAEAKILDMYGKTLWENSATLDSPEDSTVPAFDIAFDQEGLTDVYYISMELSGKDGILARNFYVRGVEYGNFRSLLELPQPSISLKCSFSEADGQYCGTAVLKNTGSSPALMIRLNLVRERSGEQILPVFYEDNYISLMPSEEREIKIRFRKEDTAGEKPALRWETCLD